VSDAGGAVAVDWVNAQHRRTRHLPAGVAEFFTTTPSAVAIDSARLSNARYVPLMHTQPDTIPRRRRHDNHRDAD